MTPLEKSHRGEQAFEIFKLLVARGTTDWDFAPLATRACDAVEVFHDVVRQRYPTNVAGGGQTEQQQQPPPPPRGPAGPGSWGT